jgi:hypothetical protein
MAVTKKSAIFWDMTPYSLVEVYRLLEKCSASTFRTIE